MGGIEFVAAALTALAAAAAVAGLVVALLEPGQPGADSPLRERLALRWAGLAATPWSEVPHRFAGWLDSAVRGLVAGAFTEADRSPTFTAVFIGLVFVFTPVAAVVNAVFGGRPRLALVYAAVAVALVLLNAIAEVPRLAVVRAAAAVFAAGVLSLLAPLYVFHSFTSRIMIENVSHALIESVPVALFLYIAAYGVLWLGRAASRGVVARGPSAEPAAAWPTFLAALPVAYVGVFVGRFVGQHAVPGAERGLEWPELVAAVAATAAALPATLAAVRGVLLRRGRGGLAAGLTAGIGVAAALSLAGMVAGRPGRGWEAAIRTLVGRTGTGDAPPLGVEFWIMHLPFVPVVAIATAIAVGIIARGVAAAFARLVQGGAQARPFLAAAATCWTAAAALVGGAAAFSS